jgi:hypothetical protein
VSLRSLFFRPLGDGKKKVLPSRFPPELLAWVEGQAKEERTTSSEMCALLVDFARQLLESADPHIMALAMDAKRRDVSIAEALTALAGEQLLQQYPQLMAELAKK